MMNTVYILINGIRTDPDDQHAWTDRLCTLLNLRTPNNVKAEKFEYQCSATFRRVGQSQRARDLIERVTTYRNEGWRVVLIGHSNGCDLIARVVGHLYVPEVHLFAPAAEDNDFAEALEHLRISRLYIYGSRNDKALKFASFTSRILRWMRLGYGSLGLRGAELAARFPHQTRDRSQHDFGHSTWFEPQRIEETLRLILTP
jgi:hypothetical protein